MLFIVFHNPPFRDSPISSRITTELGADNGIYPPDDMGSLIYHLHVGHRIVMGSNPSRRVVITTNYAQQEYRIGTLFRSVLLQDSRKDTAQFMAAALIPQNVPPSF